MPSTRFWRQFDLALLAVVLLLVTLGVIMIRSANLATEDLGDLWRKQMNFALIGLALFFVVAAIPYQWLKHVWGIGLLVGLGLLGLVLVIGESEIGDVQRWFFIGTFRLQPSFLALITLIISIASILDYRSLKEHRVEGSEQGWGRPPTVVLYILSGVVAIIHAVLVFQQPDMSTAIVFLVIWAAMAFVSDVHWGVLLTTGVLGLASLIPLWGIMKPYQRDRVLTFLNPERDLAALYNIDQAKISIGSGGLWGQGYGVGTQSQLRFLRVRHTDFIFSVIGEELGFIGAVLLLLLFAFLAWRIFRAALLAPDRFGRMVVTGVGAMLFFQVIVNVGMNLGLLPVTGLPLSFVSYGGSALMTSLVALGLVESVAMRRRQ